MAVFERRLVDRANGLCVARSPGWPGGASASELDAGMVGRGAGIGRRLEAAQFGGSQHLGDVPGGLVAAGDRGGCEARAGSRLADGRERNGDIAAVALRQFSARRKDAGESRRNRLAVVPGNGGVGNADMPGDLGLEEVLLPASHHCFAGAYRQGAGIPAFAAVCGWRLEPWFGAVFGIQLGFLSGDDRPGFVGAGRQRCRAPRG